MQLSRGHQTLEGAESIRAIAADLADRYGTPLYVYRWRAIASAWDALTRAVPYEPTSFHYAIVCNKNPAIVRRIVDLGAGIHANTPGDAFAALTAGVRPDQIVYSGTNLDGDDLRFLIERRIRCNLDSLDQLRDYVRAGGERPVGLRLLVDPPTHGSRIGVTEEEVPAAVRIAAEAGTRIDGLHMYAGTNTRRAERFLSCFDRMARVANDVPDLALMDAGGGFGIPYAVGQEPLALHELGAGLAARMEDLSAARGRRIGLVVEPGRLLVGAAGSLLMRVLSVKERGGRRFVGVDTTVGNVVVPSVYHMKHRIAAVEPRGADLDMPTDVCGNTTHSRDFIARDVRLPEVRRGDILALADVGAYGYAMSSHFLNRPRPAEVLLDGPEEHLVTRRETLPDLMAMYVQEPRT